MWPGAWELEPPPRPFLMSGQDYMNTYPSVVNLAIFAGSIFLSWVGTWAVLRWKGSWGVDRPDDRRKRHERPISRLGGLPIFIALMTGFIIMELRFPEFM